MWSYLFNVRIRVPISNRIPKFLCLCKRSPPKGESSFNSFSCKWNFFFLCDRMTEYWDTVVFPVVKSKAEKQNFQTAEECLRVCVCKSMQRAKKTIMLQYSLLISFIIQHSVLIFTENLFTSLQTGFCPQPQTYIYDSHLGL